MFGNKNLKNKIELLRKKLERSDKTNDGLREIISSLRSDKCELEEEIDHLSHEIKNLKKQLNQVTDNMIENSALTGMETGLRHLDDPEDKLNMRKIVKYYLKISAERVDEHDKTDSNISWKKVY